MEAIVYPVALTPSMIFIYWGAMSWREIQNLDSSELVGSPSEAAAAAKSLMLIGVAIFLITLASWLATP